MNASKVTKMQPNRSTSILEILKAPSDERGYRVVILPNGLTALLISEAPYYSSVTKQDLENGQAGAALCVGIGSFSDLPDFPGFAHFMEHMLNMGSKKFPKENYWDEFLAKNMGEYNAWTDYERTNFYFTIQQSEFTKALDIFANFFISPLFNKNSVDREIMAVDNECQMNSTNDTERSRGVYSYELAEEGHPMKKFTAGNKKSLMDDPREKNLSIYDSLRSFYEKMYSAHYMTLVIYSIEPLDKIEEDVIKIFSKVPNNYIPRPRFVTRPFQEKKFNKLIKIVPVEDVQKMEILWALPPLMDHYRARVVEFLSVLLGHEGKGSIISALKKRHLALELKGNNDMSGFTHNSTWTALSFNIRLTGTGMQKYQEVLEIMFQYIELLKKEIPGYVFHEQRHIEETNYIFKSPEPILEYVEELAENMHMFPPEHYLCGKTLFFEYNEQLVRDCLNCLRPEGMLVMLYDKDFKLSAGNVEPWLLTNYNISEFPPRFLQKLNDLPVSKELHLPEPNPYLTTNFKLIKSKVSQTKYPMVVYDEGGCRMWYKKDTSFQTPTTFVFFNIASAAIHKSEISLVVSDIFVSCLLQKLTESLYSAVLAGYEYSMDGTPEGLQLFIQGYSEKMHLVIENSMKTFQELTVEEHMFQYMKKNLKQIYMNNLIKPVELSRNVRESLTKQQDPSLLLRCELIDTVTYSMLEQFMKDFYYNMYIECLATGNLRPQDAVKIAKLSQVLIKKPLYLCDLKKPTVLQLPEGNSTCFMTALNSGDTNSCVIQYFQQGPGTHKNVILNEILSRAMSEPLFNSLRTEKQLGYTVYCGPSITHGILGFSVVVESQSNSFLMKDVDGYITKFLEEFVDMLEMMPEAKITEMIEDASYERKDEGDLHYQSELFWEEIIGQSYLFKRKEQELVACDTISREDILAWAKSLLEPKRKQLTLLVEGCTKPKCELNSGVNSLASIKGLIKGIRTCLPGSSGEQPTTSPVNPVEPSTGYITNLCEFKRTLKPMERHIIKE